MPLHLHSADYERYLTHPLDGPSYCDDCGKLTDITGDTLCPGCREYRKDHDTCPDCGADGGQDCLLSCGSRLV